jgi:hypothetical protein
MSAAAITPPGRVVAPRQITMPTGRFAVGRRGGVAAPRLAATAPAVATGAPVVGESERPTYWTFVPLGCAGMVAFCALSGPTTWPFASSYAPPAPMVTVPAEALVVGR